MILYNDEENSIFIKCYLIYLLFWEYELITCGDKNMLLTVKCIGFQFLIWARIMNSPLGITALIWGILCLSCPPSSQAGREDWTPHELLAYEQLTQQDCGVLSNLIPAQRLRRRITGGRKSSLLSQPWMAFLHISGDIEMCRCGGSLLSERIYAKITSPSLNYSFCLI